MDGESSEKFENNSKFRIVSKKELIENPKNWISRPHIVLLGAGASKAAFPNGDANNKKLPVMADFIDILNLISLLKNAEVDLSLNFESIYSRLKDNEIKKTLEKRIYDYFSDLRLPDTATLYDRLLLSLREKDAIFTFNWDPFLFDAYKRNCHVASLPGIFFLHGNVRIGACPKHKKWGWKGLFCCKCQTKFSDVPLLYPIEQKNYSANPYINLSWECAKQLFAAAFTITIFGYGAPTSDIDAVKLLHDAWFKKSKRELEHIEVIDIEDEETLYKRWNKFTPTLHYRYLNFFKESRLWNCPRRSCEALYYPMAEGLPYQSFPLVDTNNLTELQKYSVLHLWQQNPWFACASYPLSSRQPIRNTQNRGR